MLASWVCNKGMVEEVLNFNSIPGDFIMQVNPVFG